MERQTYSAAAANLTRGQLLDLLLDVEDRLKTLIRALFAKERRDWEDLIPKQVRDALSNKRSDAAQTRGPSSDLLDRATFGQLIDIVLARWKLFEPIIADKAWVQTTLHELRKARNQLAHGTRPGADDKVKIYLAVAEVSAKIPVAAAETVPRSLPPGRHLAGSRILWADDVPQGNSWARRLLRGFGADVVPVLSNDERSRSSWKEDSMSSFQISTEEEPNQEASSASRCMRQVSTYRSSSSLAGRTQVSRCQLAASSSPTTWLRC